MAYNQYLSRRRQNQSESDLVSVVQFDNSSRVDRTVNMQPIAHAPSGLSPHFGGTAFAPAARDACSLARGTPSSHVHVVVFMSDGGTSDSAAAAGTFSTLNREIRTTSGIDLELHGIAFGAGASTAQLAQIAGSSRNGKVHTSADTAELSDIFMDIAGEQDVARLMEAEIGKRISNAVTDKLSLEHLG